MKNEKIKGVIMTGEDIGKFLSNFLPTEPIISVKVTQYRADLRPIESEEES